MGDLPYISSEQGCGLIMIVAYYANLRILFLYKNFDLKRGWAYNTCSTVHYTNQLALLTVHTILYIPVEGSAYTL